MSFAGRKSEARLTHAWMPNRQSSQGGEARLRTRMPSEKLRISVCLIARDEDQFLDRCLSSIREIASQIVLVDTGSTDRTVDIAKSHGAEVHHFIWCDDFSAARNAGLEHARGDWILVLDADEELPKTQHLNLLRDVTDAKAIAFRLPLRNVGEAECAFVPRLIRNVPNAFFPGTHPRAGVSKPSSSRESAGHGDQDRHCGNPAPWLFQAPHRFS